jgi:hypothetical protein
MLAAGRGKVGNLDKPSCLFLETSHQLRESEAALVSGLPGEASEITDGLEMDAPYDGGQLQSLPHYVPDGVSVNPSHESGDKDDAETCFPTIQDSLEFLVKERSSSKSAVDLVIDPVELKKDRRKTSGPEPSCVT